MNPYASPPPFGEILVLKFAKISSIAEFKTFAGFQRQLDSSYLPMAIQATTLTQPHSIGFKNRLDAFSIMVNLYWQYSNS